MHQTREKEYKTRFDWVGKVISWEWSKRLKFDLTIKWCIRKSEAILENEIHKILWDFEKQTDHLIPTRKLDQVLINLKKIQYCGFCSSSGPHRKKNCEKRDK